MTQESIQPFLDWISAHPTSSGFIVFLISLSESLAIVGLIVPGVVMMTAIGGMMGTGTLPFWATLSWAILGAIAGDGISYWLGHHYHNRLREFWPFKQFPKLFARGEDFFRNHGGKSIVLGRFVGPVRPMIPVIAGMMDMTPKRFLFFNVLSALAWAPLYSLPGILIGASLGNLSPEVATRAGLLILLLLLAIWLFYEFLVLIGSGIVKSMMQIVHCACRILRRVPYARSALKTEQASEEGQLGIAILFVLSLISFCLVYSDVLHSEGVAAWNEPVYQVLRALYSDKLVAIIAFLTGLGDPWVLLPTVLMVGLWLIWRERLKTAACWLLTNGTGYAVGRLLKIETVIPRPEGLLYVSNQYAFPSGHTLMATLTFGLTAILIQNSIAKKYRWVPWALAIPLILFISISRVYLGLNWFTDVLGGLTLGTACVTLGIFFYRRIQTRPVLIRGILAPGIFALFIMLSLYSFFSYPTVRKELIREWPAHELTQSHWWKGNAETNGLYRTGAFKHHATIFDIQWLGTLPVIEQSLELSGWQVVPKLNFKTGVMLLANNPAPLLFPIMPKFHRDRLPVLTVAKTYGASKRFILQLWQSDYQSDTGIPLWVGTLRLEEAAHPLPLVTVFVESAYKGNILKEFAETLNIHPQIRIKNIPSKNAHTHKLLLLRSH